MENNVFIDGVGNMVVKISAFTGKVTVLVNGEKLKKVEKNRYYLEINNKQIDVRVFANYFKGVYAIVNGQEYFIDHGASWYEYVLAFFPLVFDMIWGNVTILCAIFPVVGGLIGGAISGLFAILNCYLMRQVKKPLAKVLIGIAVDIVTILILFLVGLMILQAIIKSGTGTN